MIRLNNYLDDGANWQAQAVLAYLRSRYESLIGPAYDEKEYNRYWAWCSVGRYENCREQGYVFSINAAGGKQKNYAVYEHRNSDQLIVLISNGLTLNTPSIDDMWRDKGENPSKYDYDKAFEYGEIVECGDYIFYDIRKTLEEWKEEREKIRGFNEFGIVFAI